MKFYVSTYECVRSQCFQTRRKPPAKKRKPGDLDDLKQELDIDFHKVTPEELYQRFQTHPENVSAP